MGSILKIIACMLLILISGSYAMTNVMQEGSVAFFTSGTNDLYLKGTHGLVLVSERSDPFPDTLRYELFSAHEGLIISTTDPATIKATLASLPPDTFVDYYDKCMSGFVRRDSYFEKADILHYCYTLGISGESYGICTCFGTIGRSKPWEWTRSVRSLKWERYRREYGPIVGGAFGILIGGYYIILSFFRKNDQSAEASFLRKYNKQFLIAGGIMMLLLGIIFLSAI